MLAWILLCEAVVAVPVAPPEAVESLREVADLVVCPARAKDLYPYPRPPSPATAVFNVHTCRRVCSLSAHFRRSRKGGVQKARRVQGLRTLARDLLFWHTIRAAGREGRRCLQGPIRNGQERSGVRSVGYVPQGAKWLFVTTGKDRKFLSSKYFYDGQGSL